MTTDPYNRLAAALAGQRELPDSLRDALLALIAQRPARLEEQQVAELARQVEDFDPYAGAGCFGDACSAATIERTLQRLQG